MADLYRYVTVFSDMRTILDKLCELATEDIVKAHGRKSALAFWQAMKEDDPLYESAQTQMFMLQHPERENLVANGGFETGDFTGWKVDGEIAVETGSSRTGNYGAEGKGSLTSEITVKSGERYRLSAWGMYSSVPQPGTVLFSTQVSFRGKDATVYPAEPNYRRLKQALSSGSWAFLEMTFAVPPEADAAVVLIKSELLAAFDDIRLEKIQDAPLAEADK